MKERPTRFPCSTTIRRSPVLLLVFLIACSKPSDVQANGAATATTTPVPTAPSPQAKAAPASSPKDVLAANDASKAVLADFKHLKAWKFVPDERKREPKDEELRSGAGFDIHTDADAFFAKECPALSAKMLAEKDEFDRPRANAAKRTARTRCLDAVEKTMGARPKFVRVRVEVSKYFEWSGGSFVFRLEDGGGVSRSLDASSRTLELSEYGETKSCGGPHLIAIRAPERCPLEFQAYGVTLSISDANRAKAAKARFVASKPLSVEFFVELGEYGATGRTCRNVLPPAMGGGVFENEVQGYNAKMIGLRLVDRDTALTNWTPADAADIPETALIVPGASPQ